MSVAVARSPPPRTTPAEPGARVPSCHRSTLRNVGWSPTTVFSDPSCNGPAGQDGVGASSVPSPIEASWLDASQPSGRRRGSDHGVLRLNQDRR